MGKLTPGEYRQRLSVTGSQMWMIVSPFFPDFVWESTTAKIQYTLDPTGPCAGAGLSSTATLDLKCYGMGEPM